MVTCMIESLSSKWNISVKNHLLVSGATYAWNFTLGQMIISQVSQVIIPVGNAKGQNCSSNRFLAGLMDMLFADCSHVILSRKAIFYSFGQLGIEYWWSYNRIFSFTVAGNSCISCWQCGAFPAILLASYKNGFLLLFKVRSPPWYFHRKQSCAHASAYFLNSAWRDILNTLASSALIRASANLLLPHAINLSFFSDVMLSSFPLALVKHAFMIFCHFFFFFLSGLVLFQCSSRVFDYQMFFYHCMAFHSFSHMILF